MGKSRIVLAGLQLGVLGILWGCSGAAPGGGVGDAPPGGGALGNQAAPIQNPGLPSTQFDPEGDPTEKFLLRISGPAFKVDGKGEIVRGEIERMKEGPNPNLHRVLRFVDNQSKQFLSIPIDFGTSLPSRAKFEFFFPGTFDAEKAEAGEGLNFFVSPSSFSRVETILADGFEECPGLPCHPSLWNHAKGEVPNDQGSQADSQVPENNVPPPGAPPKPSNYERPEGDLKLPGQK